MGKARVFPVLAALALSLVVIPTSTRVVRAQGASGTQPAGCSGQPSTSPMQGHYTGPWHSDADYHFNVNFPAYGTVAASSVDLEMKITIDGTLDMTVSPNGQIAGTAKGNLDAPIFHDGSQDISSGIGSISGTITGYLAGGDALLILSHPVIDMHWGTFGGGHAVETFPRMPDYHFSVSATDCVSAAGTLTESGFPDMNITDDGTGQLTHAPGLGLATGTWQLTSDKSQQFKDLSRNVDDFISRANTILGNLSALTPEQIEQGIVQPLKSLEASIHQEPDISRCLLDRLGAWEAVALPPLYAQVQTVAHGQGPASLRLAAQLLGAVNDANIDCSLPDGGARMSIMAAARAQLDAAISARSWTTVALVLRETILLGGKDTRAGSQAAMNADLHRELLNTGDDPGILELARVSYAIGDDADANAAVQRLTSHNRPFASAHHPRVQSRAGPTPAPTAVPQSHPKPIYQILRAGLARMKVQVAATDGRPSFSWQPVPKATQYVLFVVSQTDHDLLWAWSGAGTSVTYGDTSLEGAPVAGTSWPAALPAGHYHWTVLALNGNQIAGVKFRTKG